MPARLEPKSGAQLPRAIVEDGCAFSGTERLAGRFHRGHGAADLPGKGSALRILLMTFRPLAASRLPSEQIGPTAFAARAVVVLGWAKGPPAPQSHGELDPLPIAPIDMLRVPAAPEFRLRPRLSLRAFTPPPPPSIAEAVEVSPGEEKGNWLSYPTPGVSNSDPRTGDDPQLSQCWIIAAGKRGSPSNVPSQGLKSRRCCYGRKGGWRGFPGRRAIPPRGPPAAEHLFGLLPSAGGDSQRHRRASGVRCG